VLGIFTSLFITGVQALVISSAATTGVQGVHCTSASKAPLNQCDKINCKAVAKENLSQIEYKKKSNLIKLLNIYNVLYLTVYLFVMAKCNTNS